MIAKIWSDWKRYIVNCKEEELRDKIKQIVEKWGRVLWWDVCPWLQALIKNDREVDIWVEVVKPIWRSKMIQQILKQLDEKDKPTETTSF